jgi:hypothetical protein
LEHLLPEEEGKVTYMDEDDIDVSKKMREYLFEKF